MEKVLISVSFGRFKKTKFTNFWDAVSFVKESNTPNTRLKLTNINTVQTWDNF